MIGGPDREGFAAFMLRMRGRGGVPAHVLSAFEATPRGPFLSGQFQELAWSDRALPIECGEAIEGADLQAQIVAALGFEPGNRVLEIGTGTGYTAAVISRLAGRVTTLDRYKTLVEQARMRFEQFGIQNVIARQADGTSGLANEGPFDRIVVWAAFDSHPRIFVDQLSTGGTMVAAIGPEEGKQVLVRLTKVGSRFEREDIGAVRFQPILKGAAAVL
ncbi:protein-L-isoaspartate(D-aspartate) O-methyltransferase [Mesorhizobium sp. LHD-90]|uniref:protein-L-isoaspartate(D-aspartate) O-methyltransferase n=1 Tax=Mesorhizobium sp. LHD-90 TaxID=3071414 RepID=UPI0027E1DCAF|nr:protein-L-isoaspartate(D-aspartate) O-methyltransferase [Mesorhizobium sp. LHD-90]MDQ6432935.1 protein-L-isoaspartate(D-aspartate) O-methyltransferase [Mesorhizobium sp. LHD-90]